MKNIFIIIFLFLAGEILAQYTPPSSYTTNYRFRKWSLHANPGADSLNANWNELDYWIYRKGDKDTNNIWTDRNEFTGAFKLAGRDTAKQDYLYRKNNHFMWRKNDTTEIALDSALVGKADTSLPYIWTGLHQFTQDSIKISGLWYDFPSTRVANSVLYDSLGDGILKWKSFSFIDTTKIGYLAKANSWTGKNSFRDSVSFRADTYFYGTNRFYNGGYYTTLSAGSLGGNNTLTMPITTGTFALTSIAGGGTNATTFTTGKYIFFDGTRLKSSGKDSLSFVGKADSTAITGYATQSDILTKEPTLTKGNLTESVTGLQFDNTRQVIGGAAALSLTSGYVIPTTTEQTNWGTAYTNRIATFTTTGSSGSATFSSNTLNIPTYTLAGLGGISLTALSGTSPISYNNSTGAISFLTNTAISWTGKHSFRDSVSFRKDTYFYGTNTIGAGSIKTANAGTPGYSGFSIGTAGIFGYDATLGTTFSLPTNGDAPTFSSGVINKVTFNLYDAAVIRTSATVGNGGALSNGILMNDTGIAGYPANSSTPKFTLSTTTGTVTATDVTLTGAINATSGKFGTATNYWSVGSTGLTATSASTDVIINYGKTDFAQDATAGFILGYDYSATKSKFEIGSGATKLFKFDGTDLTLTGGTITGGTLQTATGTGQRVVIAGASNDLKFYDTGNNNIVRIGEDVNSTLDGIVTTNGMIYSVTNLAYSGIVGTNTNATDAKGISGFSNGATNNKAVVGQVTGGTSGSNYGVYSTVQSSGGTSLNYGIYATATGGATNYAGYFDEGSVGIGAGKFIVNGTGQITKINNVVTSGYVPISNGTHYEPRALASTDLNANVSTTEFGYLDGVTSAIQTQMNTKVAYAYGELYDNTGASTITTNNTNYVKWTNSTVGAYSGVTGSTANDNLTIDTGKDGTYRVEYSVSFNAEDDGDYYWTVNVAGSPLNKARQKVTATALVTYNVSGTALVALSATNTIDIGCFGGASNVVNVTYVNVNITKVSN